MVDPWSTTSSPRQICQGAVASKALLRPEAPKEPDTSWPSVGVVSDIVDRVSSTGVRRHGLGHRYAEQPVDRMVTQDEAHRHRPADVRLERVDDLLDRQLGLGRAHRRWAVRERVVGKVEVDDAAVAARPEEALAGGQYVR